MSNKMRDKFYHIAEFLFDSIRVEYSNKIIKDAGKFREKKDLQMVKIIRGLSKYKIIFSNGSRDVIEEYNGSESGDDMGCSADQYVATTCSTIAKGIRQLGIKVDILPALEGRL